MRIEHGDMRDVLARLIADKTPVHAIVTDPPYHLTSIIKRFGSEAAAPAQVGRTGAYARASAGFMGKKWDGGDIAFQSGPWRLCWELLPPGGHLIAFGGTRTYHRMVLAIEEAGFEIRDQLAWIFGSGFPKAHSVEKALDPRTPEEIETGIPQCAESLEWKGWSTAIKPAFEPVCLARKPLSGTVAQTVLKHGTGALNIDGCRIRTEGGTNGATAGPSNGILGDGLNGARGVPVDGLGRWPANVCHDGSDEVVSAFPETQSGVKEGGRYRRAIGVHEGGQRADGLSCFGDSGSAARFFYSAKADAGDRLGSKHPTVKPVDLMRWLVRLITPPGGTVLDPFAGSGTTGMACMAEGIDCILIEREAEYVADIKARLAHVRGDDTPLFKAAE